MMSALLSMIPFGYDAMEDHVGSRGAPALAPGSSSCWPLIQPGVYGFGLSASPWTRCNGAPCRVRIVKFPARSASFAFTGAPPVLVNFTVFVAVEPSPCVLDTDCGSIVRRPAASEKSARVELSAATFTVLLSAWYGDLVALKG